MFIKNFEDIVAWQKSHQLVLLVYKLTDKYPKQEVFGLTSQSRRCGVSIPSNIAEGFRRRTVNDSLHFYNISQGSLEELRYQMILARDLSYIIEAEYERFNLLAQEVSKVLNGWIKSQGKSV
jgi:four helix bundle protein